MTEAKSESSAKQRKSARVGAKRRASEAGDQEARKGDASSQRVYAYNLALFPGEPEGVPKAVLCHLYTGALPDDPEQLIWVSVAP